MTNELLYINEKCTYKTLFIIGRYILLNSVADHLRYPNSHTCFFSKTLLHLFATQPEELKEQITR